MKRDTSIPPTQGEDDRAPDRRTGKLMPLEAAAKAIFVKANGLGAYQDATGTGNRATDWQPDASDKDDE